MRICRREKGAAPWRDAKFFSVALGLTAPLAWPVRAFAQASDQAPPKPENVLPPDQAFERLVEGERALHELRCQTPRFPAECEALELAAFGFTHSLRS
jgi:hypothetical protein